MKIIALICGVMLFLVLAAIVGVMQLACSGMGIETGGIGR